MISLEEGNEYWEDRGGGKEYLEVNLFQKDSSGDNGMRGELLLFVEGRRTEMLVSEGVEGQFEGVEGLSGDPCN